MSRQVFRSAVLTIALLAIVAGLAGCAKEKIVYVEVTPVPEGSETSAEPPLATETEENQDPAPQAPVQEPTKPPRPTRVPPTATPVPPTATPTFTFTPTSTPTPAPIPVTVPTGALMDVEFLQHLSSHDSQAGQEFSARVVDPVMLDGRVAIPAGSIISGTVTEAKPAKKVGGRSRLSLDFDLIELPTGHRYPIHVIFSQKGKSSTGRDVAIIGGATVGGAILGHQVDGDKGKEIGAIVGAIAGAIAASETRAKPVELAAGTVMTLEVSEPVYVEIIP